MAKNRLKLVNCEETEEQKGDGCIRTHIQQVQGKPLTFKFFLETCKEDSDLDLVVCREVSEAEAFATLPEEVQAIRSMTRHQLSDELVLQVIFRNCIKPKWYDKYNPFWDIKKQIEKDIEVVIKKIKQSSIKIEIQNTLKDRYTKEFRSK